MKYLDFHTHNCSNLYDRQIVLNLMPPFVTEELCKHGIIFMAGIHPWYISDNWNTNLVSLAHLVKSNKNMIACGEIGLDRMCDTDWTLQLEVFEAQLALADRMKIPVVIHCVKGWAELLSMKKKYKAVPAWIIHGFRGKPSVALQMLDKGFYLSFGINFNEESVRLCPKEKMFVETDEAVCDIKTLYERIAFCHNTDAENLNMQCLKNLEKILSFRDNVHDDTTSDII